MTLDELARAVEAHSGTFHCHRIHEEKTKKVVRFFHVVEPPDGRSEVPNVGRLPEFYRTFGSILFYHDEKSGDAGKYIANPSEWSGLEGGFNGWVDILDEDERDGALPDWIENSVVIGETPHSGNYILVPTKGKQAGRVFEFDHDGFEFTSQAKDIVEYVRKLLKPDGSLLTEIASHMRFVEDNGRVQWWIEEMKDNTGHVAYTRV